MLARSRPPFALSVPFFSPASLSAKGRKFAGGLSGTLWNQRVTRGRFKRLDCGIAYLEGTRSSEGAFSSRPTPLRAYLSLARWSSYSVGGSTARSNSVTWLGMASSRMKATMSGANVVRLTIRLT